MRPERRTGKFQRGISLAGVLGFVLALALIGFGIWRFAPEYLPAALRDELPRSPLDLSSPLNAEADTTGANRVPANATASDPNPPLYKWRDAAGVWNITDKPPAGRPYETVLVNPETNIMPADPATASETPVE